MAAFRFRWVPFMATLCVVAAGIALGQWQMQRAHAKQVLAAQLRAGQQAPAQQLTHLQEPSEALEFRRVRVTGEFIRSWPLYLDNRPHQGRAGLYVLMPLKIAGTERAVLVARGWLPRDPADRLRVAPYSTPIGPVEIQGVVRRHAGRLLQLGQPPPPAPGAFLQNLEPREVAQASGLALYPFIIEQTSATEDGLVRDWPRPSAGIDKHYGYAFQWYALAATAFIFFLISGFRHAKK